MSSYKVIQDVEAEDKLLGPLTLRQFIYGLIAALNFFLAFIVITKNLWPAAIIFIPIGLAAGFFAFPWGRDQPTELWALAKIRYMVKPRKRVWNQSGIKELVTITVPKKIEQVLTNNLSQTEIKSRLQALAETIDTRGWAVKNANVSGAFANPAFGQNYQSSDRLVEPSAALTYVNPVLDVRPADDVMDAQHNPLAHQFDDMIALANKNKHDRLVAKMQAAAAISAPQAPSTQNQPAPPAEPENLWFMNQPAATPASQNAGFAPNVGASVPIAATPTAEEETFFQNLPQETPFTSGMHGHIPNIKPLSEQPITTPAPAENQTAGMTQPPSAAILDLSRNNDFNVATLAREAQKREVVVNLH